MEDRVHELERQVSTLREYRAGDAAVMSGLSRDVAALTTAVNQLNNTLNRARGAIWVIGVGAVAITEGVHRAIDYLFPKHP